MRISWKIFVIVFSVIYVVVTLVAIYKLYTENKKSSPDVGYIHNERYEVNSSEPRRHHTVEIWGKASIGMFLWKHILNGELQDIRNGLIQKGYLTVDDITFVYRYGAGVIQTTVPSDVEYLVLVLNGRSEEKIETAKLWLDYLPMYKNLKKLAVVLLGDESCNNNWILPYLHSHGGRVNVVFLVYDSPLVDNEEFYQWPLGVAVYRGFPNIKHDYVDVTSPRSHVCNFLGTVYENSSREVLMQVIKSVDYQDSCIVLGRKQWQPLETPESLKYYMDSLLKSDLTLCPVGKNTECYRIYEAMSLGSVPVIENVRTKGRCDDSLLAPLRILKQYEAPVIYVNTWHDLYELVKQEAELTLDEKVERRTAVIRWYAQFKKIMGDHFIRVIRHKFFSKH